MPGLYEAELVPVNGDTGSFQVTATTITDPTASLTIGGPAVSVDAQVLGERPTWTFSGTAGQKVYLQWSPNCACNANLMAPDGSRVAQDNRGGNYLTAQLPTSGAYTFVMDIDGSIVGTVGTYTAQVSVVPADAAATTTVGGTASLTISQPGQNGSVSFSGSAGEHVFIRADFGTQPEGAAVAVLGPDGSLIGQAMYGGGSEVAVDTVALPGAGTYQVRLTMLTELDSSTAATVGYTGTISVTVTNAPDVTASATVDGGAVSLAIAQSGEHGVVTFGGTAGEKVYTALTMSPSMSETGSAEVVQEPGGTVLGSNSLTGASGYIDTVTLPAAGTYELIADPVSNTGAYTGTITAAVTSAPDQTATTSVGGTAASVPLGKPGERAVVSFAGTAGQEVFTQISVTGAAPNCSSDTTRLIDTATGLAVAFGGSLSTPPDYIDDTSLPATDTYEVVVAPCGGYTGTVTVTVTSVPAAATATGTYGGAAVTVTITKPGQDGSVTFTGVPAGAAVKLNVTASTFPASPSPTGNLLDSSGNYIISACFLTVGTTQCTGTATTAGTYTLQVTHSGPYTGSVTVQLTAASAGAVAAVARAAFMRQRWRFTNGEPAVTMATRRQPPTVGAARPALRHGAPRWAYTGPSRPLPRASLTGTILTTAGAPLAGITVRVAARSARTDGRGHFTLTGLPQGMQILEMDGRTASTRQRSFGAFDVQVRLRAGVNRLPFTSYFPALDTADEVSVSEPLARSVTLTTRAIPGLKVNLPKGVRITDADGKPVYRIGITAIPVNRTPIPMPVGEQVPVYFTVQPAGGHISNGWATIDYPNYHNAKPGTPFSFWHYDLHGAGWGIYGSGSVTSTGTEVTPGPDTWVTDFNGAMITTSGYPDPNQSWLEKFLALSADPVDPGTGLFHMTQTDLVVPDVIPLTLTRGYNAADGNARQFGNNSSDLYDTFLTHDQPEPTLYTEADLNLVDGARIHFTRITPGTSFSTAVMRAGRDRPVLRRHPCLERIRMEPHPARRYDPDLRGERAAASDPRRPWQHRADLPDVPEHLR